MRSLTVIAILLPLFGVVNSAHAQVMGVPLGGPEYECRQSWDFIAGTVQVRFSAGYHVGGAAQAPRFESMSYCGNSGITISLSEWVKNVRMRVYAGGYPADIFPGGGSVNPGGTGRIVTVPGPTTVVYISSSNGGSVTVSEITFELADPPALFFFGATTTGRVLTHKYRSDDAYPSPLQTEDGKIRVEGLVTDVAGRFGIPGRKVYFRLIDPPDTADYVVKAGDARVGDNIDGPGKLNGDATATDTSDANGKVSVTLEITDHAAGDNYQVEASFDPNFTCSPMPCQNQKSIVYTAWKRVYVEVNKMYRRSAFLTWPVVPGDKTLLVSDVRPFPSPPFDALLVHGPAPGSGSSAFSSEVVRIVAKTRVPLFSFGPFPGKLELDPDSKKPGVSGLYDGPPGLAADKPRDFLADAVAYVTGDRTQDFYLVSGQLANAEFTKAFVEYVWLTDAGLNDPDLLPDQPRLAHDGGVPYVELMNQTNGWQREWMTRKWSRHVDRGSGTRVIAKPNHHVVFTAARRFEPNPQQTEYAATTVGSNSNDLWFWLDRIPAGVEPEAMVHELAHQWRVNHPPGTTLSNTGGHCDVALGVEQKMALHATAKCTMTSYMYSESSASDGIVGFHYWKPAAGSPVHSEYLHIRHRTEPIPQNEFVRPEPPK